MVTTTREIIMDNEMEPEQTEVQSRTQKTKHLGLSYLVHENPPWYICMLLGFQHFLVAAGSTVTLTFILSSAMCFGNSFLALSEVLSTILFVSGIVTLLQSVVGIRLPIIQGGSFSFLAPTLAILSLPQWTCPSKFVGNTNSSENASGVNDGIWKPRMREIQGAIMVSSCFQIIVGFSGLIGLLLRFIGPLTIAPTITLVGLSLFRVAADYAGRHWGISMMTIVLIALFSQCLSKIKIPVPAFKKERGGLYVGHFPLFRLFSIILAIAVSWGICGIITATGGFSSDPDSSQYSARTDTRGGVLKDAKWFRLPYPGQWGRPTISVAGVLGMLAGPLTGSFEALGSYYACARLSGAPSPPKHAINRGIGIQGIGCIVAGAFGGGNGMTVYNENIGAIGITKAASLRIVQFAALFMTVVGVLGKIGALFVSIPDPIVGGVFMVMFGMIAAVGISNLQFADMNSSRNVFIVGFSLVFGLALPYYLANHPGSIRTGVDEVDQILTVLLSTSMVVGCMLGLILDNLIPGTAEERGLTYLQKVDGVANDEQVQKSPVEIYDLPFGFRRLSMLKVARFLPFLPYKEVYGNAINPAGGNESLDTRL